IWFVTASALPVLSFSVSHLPLKQLDVRFLLLALATVLIGPRLSIPIPRVKARISVSDTFIFLALLLFGGEAAILLATIEGVCSSLRLSNKVRTHFFNAAVMACATFLTVEVLRLSFGETVMSRDVYLQDYMVV